MAKRVYNKRQQLTNTDVEKLEPGERYYDVADSKQPGLKVRVYPTGRKMYYVWFQLPDGPRGTYQVGNAATLTVPEARTIARRHLLHAANGIDPRELKRQARGHTLQTFLDEVYSEQATIKTAQENVERVKRCFAKWLNKPLTHITTERVRAWRSKRRAGGASDNTVNRDIAGLRGVLTAAVEAKALSTHPLTGLGVLKLDANPTPRYLKPAEVKQFHEALEARETELREKRERFNKWRRARKHAELPDLRNCAFADHLKPMIILALNTGMRRGEIFNLTWADVELEGDKPRLTIRGAGAKSGHTRHIPLNAAALGALTGWKAQTTDTGLVFKSPKGGGRFNNINSAWADLMGRTEIDSFRFHDCRHHFASMLVQKGIDLNVVRELLGHADLKLTLRYAHLAPDNAASAVAALD